MGAWDATSFGNDTACDWLSELEDSEDLVLVRETLQAVLNVGGEYLGSDEAVEAIAAMEVLASLRGHPAAVDSYNEKLADWVEAHPAIPSQTLIEKALTALDRIQGENSELVELWVHDPAWAVSVTNLRTRLTI